MAEIYQLDMNSPECLEWVNSRPSVIQAMIQSHPPNRLYRDKRTNQRLILCSYSEDRTVRAHLSGQYNRVTIERDIFGIPIDELEECDLPIGEEVGVMFTEEDDINEYIRIVKKNRMVGSDVMSDPEMDALIERAVEKRVEHR